MFHWIRSVVILTACISTSAMAQQENLSILTDIAPVHSLVSMIVGEHAQVDVLVPPSQSPHDFVLKPSQVKSIATADLIVLLESDVSPAIYRYVESTETEATVLTIPMSMEESHDWLNPETAVNWLATISVVLSDLDQPNAESYRYNEAQATKRLKSLFVDLKAELQGLSDKPYIVYHDAYTEFAHAFDLHSPLAIAQSDARAPGAARLLKMRQMAYQSECIFSEAQHDDAIIDMVSDGLSIKRGILDPLGSTISIGKAHYPSMMENLAADFQRCMR